MKAGKHKILFVCLGNICRSPSAEAVFKKLVKDAGLESLFEIDSAGLINYHEGEMADPRMRAHAIRRGYQLDSISRPSDHWHGRPKHRRIETPGSRPGDNGKGPSNDRVLTQQTLRSRA